MFDKLQDLVEKFHEIEQKLSQPGLSGAELTQLSRDRSELVDIVESYEAYKKANESLAEAKEMLKESDSDMRDLAKEEISGLEKEILEIEERLTYLTLPRDPNDAKNVILEIRAGTGGDEAALFVGDLFRMYTKNAESSGWKVEILSSTEADMGGFKEVIAMISGERVYSRMKFESGVHRVQRVPTTESQGRIHTSACTVAILPEADEVEVDINPNDLDITVCRASGAGGQHVNTTDSAVRIVHKPSGIAVECQDERSQHKNKDKAMKVLQARLFEKYQREQHDAISADRKSQVGSGDRSERIRTYNFPQGRVTDHRINLTLYNLAEFIEGEMNKVLDALGTDHQAKLLKEQGSDAGGFS
jgi:peptide chain release factor 1